MPVPANPSPYYTVLQDAIQGNLLAITFLFIVMLVMSVGLAIFLTAKITTWKNRVDSVSGNLEDFKKVVADFMKEIRDDVKDILGRLDPAVSRPGSPTTLTNLGNKVAEDIQAEQWVPQYAKSHNHTIAESKSPDEIQEECLHHAKLFLLGKLTEQGRQDIIDAMESSAYQNGLRLAQVYEVVGIKLRDEILKIRGLA